MTKFAKKGKLMNQCQMSGRMKSVEEEEGIDELPLGLGGEW